MGVLVSKPLKKMNSSSSKEDNLASNSENQVKCDIDRKDGSLSKESDLVGQDQGTSNVAEARKLDRINETIQIVDKKDSSRTDPQQTSKQSKMEAKESTSSSELQSSLPKCDCFDKGCSNGKSCMKKSSKTLASTTKTESNSVDPVKLQKNSKKPKKHFLKGISGTLRRKCSTKSESLVEPTSETPPHDCSSLTTPVPSTSCICSVLKSMNSNDTQNSKETCPSTTVSAISPSSPDGLKIHFLNRMTLPMIFQTSSHIILGAFNPDDYPIEDEDEKMRRQRAKEMVEGVEISDKFKIFTLNGVQPAHSQVDYIHCLVPDLKEITSCSFYWGKIDRYAAEKLLDEKPEGTFLLRDSAQEEYLFSVSFRRYGRSLHARIEQWNHSFSFDAHDPSVFSAPTVTGLIEHYKDPSYCMFFEPMLTVRLYRNFTFSLQNLARAEICKHVTYDSISFLPLPKQLKAYCREYHYKQRVRVRNFPE